MITYWKLIRHNAGYRTLMARELISTFGTSFSNIVVKSLLISFWNSPISISLFSAGESLLLFFLTIFSGFIIDLYSNIKIVVFVDILSMLMDILLILSGYFLIPWLFIVGNIGLIISKSLSHPAADSFFPQIVSKEEIISANVFTETLEGFVKLFAIGIGGIITAYIGKNYTLIIDAVTYLIAGFLFSSYIWAKKYYHFYEIDENIKLNNKQISKFKMSKDFIKYIFTNELGFIILIRSWYEFINTTFSITNIILAGIYFNKLSEKTLVKISLPLAICYLTSSLGDISGPLIGNFIVSFNKNDKIYYRWVYGLAMIIATLGILSMSITCNMGKEITWLLACFLFSFGSGIIEVFTKSMFQIDIASKYRGRAFTFLLGIKQIFSIIGSLLIGYIWFNSNNNSGGNDIGNDDDDFLDLDLDLDFYKATYNHNNAYNKYIINGFYGILTLFNIIIIIFWFLYLHNKNLQNKRSHYLLDENVDDEEEDVVETDHIIYDNAV